jgi:hypothetical protein
MQPITEFKDLVLIDDISQYTEEQIQDVIKRSEGERMFGEIHNAPVKFWDIARASHIVKNIRVEDDKLIGDVYSIHTAFGKALDGLATQFDMKKYIQPAMYSDAIRTFHFIMQQSNDGTK